MIHLCSSSERILAKIIFKCYYSSKPSWNVLFFGTDQFSLYTLKLLNTQYSKSGLLKKLDVVTSIKKNVNIIEKYAKQCKLPVYDWPNIPMNTSYDVGLVVSFGYLIPECIIAKFPYGILNVHASLLPKWRGAAPIIHAIANGDKETGITVMRIKPHHFDVGEILLQEKMCIDDHIEMPELHQCLGELGAKSVIKTLENLPEYIKNSKAQSDDNISYAPKIHPEFAHINWNEMSSIHIYNLYRALKGHLPLTTTWQGIPTKLTEIKLCGDDSTCNSEDKKPGYIIYDKRTTSLKVLCADGTFVIIRSIGLFGKRIISGSDFSNGFLNKTSVDLRYFK